jgi:hypothetical protein
VLDDLDTNGPVTVTGGDSFAASTGQVGGAGSVAVASPGIVAFASTPSPATGPYSPDPVVGTPTDALASAPRPAFPATPAPTDTVVCGPSGVSSLPSAVYQDIEVRGPCTTSGVLTVTRQLRVFGAGRLTSVGATIHLTCGSRTAPTVCPPDTTNRGWIRVDVGGVLTIAGPTASRFSVVADPGNARDLRVSGTVTLDRALYARSVELDIRTNGALSVSDITVANDLTVASGGAVTVDSSGATANEAFQPMIERLPEEQADFLRFYVESLPALTVAQMLLTPVLAVIGIYVVAALLHVALLVLRGAGRGFDATLTAVAYAAGLAVLNAVPGCGFLLFVIWGIVVLIIGLGQIQRCGPGKAFAAVLAPAALACVCLCAAIGVSAPFLKALGEAARQGGTTSL